MTFIDTNYFLRFLLRDNQKQYLQAKQVFIQGARGEEKLVTSNIVLFEIYWVFKSYYKKNKLELLNILDNVLKMSFIEFENRALVRNALLYFKKTNLSLEDCYNLAYAKSRAIKEFMTFDAKLVKEFRKKL